MSPARTTEFRNVGEGQGKVFALKAEASSDASEVLSFGTRNCHSCVGLFLPLPSKNSAYVAHVNAWVLHIEEGKEKYDRIAGASEGQQIKTQVSAKLHTIFSNNDWTATDVDTSAITLICPGLDGGGSWNYSTGWYVVDAIREFLGRPGGLRCDQGSHGFVYDPSSGQIDKLPVEGSRQDWFRTKVWVQKVGGVEWEYSAIDQEDELDDWEIEVERP